MAIYANRGLKVIKYLIKKEANVNLQDTQNLTVLHYAITNNQVDVIKYLLKSGANISKNASQLIKDKVEFFRDPNKFDLNRIRDGSPRLHMAIQSKDLDWAKFIIHNGGNVNIENSEGQTPLHIATKFNKVEIVKLLFQYGAMYDKADKSDKKPIALSSNTEILLIFNTLDKLFGSQDLGKSLKELYSERNKWSGWVHNDAWDSDNPMLFLLNARNREGKTLLHIAANINNFHGFYTLLKFNDDCLKKYTENFNRLKYYQPMSINAIDTNGNTPLHIAAQEGHEILVDYLLKKGAIFNVKNKQGKTPFELAGKDDVKELLSAVKSLFDAAKEGGNKFTELVTQKSQYINVKNESAKTLLSIVVLSDKSNVDIIKLLFQQGIDINYPDINGYTPPPLCC